LADPANAAISMCRGNELEAAMYLACAVPGVGELRKISGSVGTFVKGTRAVRSATRVIQTARCSTNGVINKAFKLNLPGCFVDGIPVIVPASLLPPTQPANLTRAATGTTDSLWTNNRIDMLIALTGTAILLAATGEAYRRSKRQAGRIIVPPAPSLWLPEPGLVLDNLPLRTHASRHLS
jgi:hypothetical protein